MHNWELRTQVQNLAVPHGSSNNDANLTYQFFEIGVRGSDLKVSDFIISLLDSSSNNPVQSNYRGNFKTDESARFSYMFQTSNNVVIPNTINGIAAIDKSAILVSYAENQLILAETYLRAGDAASALNSLNAHRSSLLTQMSPFGNPKYDAYTSEDFQSGGIENQDGLSVNNAILREILEERYVSLFGTTENFSDTRRTYNEVDVRVSVAPNTGSELPQRFLYPQTEVDRNANIPSPLPGFFEPTRVNQ